jgi:hypothetical protein
MNVYGQTAMIPMLDGKRTHPCHPWRRRALAPPWASPWASPWWSLQFLLRTWLRVCATAHTFSALLKTRRASKGEARDARLAGQSHPSRLKPIHPTQTSVASPNSKNRSGCIRGSSQTVKEQHSP